MVTFRSNNTNNNRRPPFRSNNNRRPPFRSNNEGSKFSNNNNFQRSVPGRNNHNAVKLIEKYNDLAREALASEDKILSENYFQHADHFTRVQNEQENIRMTRVNSSPAASVNSSPAASVNSSPAASVNSSPAASVNSSPAASVNSSPAATEKVADVSHAVVKKPAEVKDENSLKPRANTVKKTISEPIVKTVVKTNEKKTIEKKSAAS